MRLPGLADAVIDTVRARYGDREAAALLAACGAGTVRRLLPLLAYGKVSWKGIARRHGDVVLDHAAVMLAAAARPDRARIWAELGTGILAAAPAHPEAVLDLLERFAPEGELPRPAGDLRYLGVLCAAAPQRVIRLLVAPGRARWLGRVSLPAAVLDRIRAVDPRDLVTLGRLWRGRDPVFAGLLRALPPARRGTVYDAVLAEVDTADDAPGPEVMEALPRDWRYREARRVLSLPRIASQESETVFWSAYLPWAEAVPALTGWLRSPSPIERMAANAFLVQAARHSQDPEVAAELVARLPRLRNEQDPVRASALRGLAGLARLLRPGSAGTLTTLVTDALQARDASSQTLGALGNLAVAVLTHHDDPELVRWALHTLDRLPSLPPLGTLRRGSETLIFARLRDWIVAGCDRGDFDRLFAVARALGRRARNVPELQELLGRAVDAGNTSYVLRQAIELWLDDPSHPGRPGAGGARGRPLGRAARPGLDHDLQPAYRPARLGAARAAAGRPVSQHGHELGARPGRVRPALAAPPAAGLRRPAGRDRRRHRHPRREAGRGAGRRRVDPRGRSRAAAGVRRLGGGPTGRGGAGCTALD